VACKKERHQVSKRYLHSLELGAPSFFDCIQGEESPEIESFEERIARFDVETMLQQWYGYASFSGFGFDNGGMAGASSSHPPPFDSPPPSHTHHEGEDEGEQDEDDE
jgi:hypothetical protein